MPLHSMQYLSNLPVRVLPVEAVVLQTQAAEQLDRPAAKKPRNDARGTFKSFSYQGRGQAC